jgi:hypothetical protein
LLGVGSCYDTLVWAFGYEIEFVTGEGDDDVFVGLSLQFFYPGFCFI